MGSSWSKEKTVENPQVETRPATIEKSGSKRSFNSDEVESNPSKKKRGQFKKKNSWAKKEGKDKKMKNETGGLQTRPESLGPREPRIPKKKVALMVGFNGTGYQGMQLNPGCNSIESVLFDALCKANAISKDNSDDPKKSQWMRAARTDKGVHAAGNLLSFKMQIPEDYDVIERVNSFLPEQIRVWGYVPVIGSFHAKNLCDSRVYEYLLPTCAFMKPIEKIITDEPTNEDDIRICASNDANPVIKYTTRSSPELIQERHNYRATPQQLETFTLALKEFEGTHNFHNYTNGKSYHERSAQRYIMSIDVSSPLYIDGSEWVSIKLHGQSFILHQIRKMISMAMLITRTNTPISLIADTFENTKINIPKAPALGLLLERPIFRVYNDKMRKKSANMVERDEISFDKYNDKIEAFKKEWIYTKIFEAEREEHVFDGYLTSLDSHIGPDYLYLNEDGIIPDECLVSTKYNTIKSVSDDEKEEED